MRDCFQHKSAVYLVLLLFISAVVMVFSLPPTQEEVRIYMDPKNNVVCYYTKHSMQCFTYTDEGTHLQLTC